MQRKFCIKEVALPLFNPDVLNIPAHKFFFEDLVTVCSSNTTVKVQQLLVGDLNLLMGSQFGKGWEKSASQEPQWAV